MGNILNRIPTLQRYLNAEIAESAEIISFFTTT